MSRNRRRSSNRIEVGSMAKFVVVAIFLCVLGVAYVSIKNRLHEYGEVRSGLEQRLHELREANEVIHVQIVRWSSRAMLQERLERGFIDMEPIDDERIVRLNVDPYGEMGGLRAVANEMER